VDQDQAKIAGLARLEIPFFEPGLPEIVARNVREGRLGFASELRMATRGSEVIFITVGTPPLPGGGADTRAIFDVARAVAENLEGYTLVVQKSTAPVGTARAVWRAMKRWAPRNSQFDVGSNPEFLREGSAIETFMHPDRVVIGAETERAVETLKSIHDPLFLIETPIVVASLETAELIKYAANSFLATKISFINEIANLCEAVGADVQVVAKAIGMDRRIGPKFLHAGPGYGGSCFPKDTLALSSFARAAGVRTKIVDAAIAANEHQMHRMVSKVIDAIGAPRGKRAGILGLAFKPNTDDLREAPALKIIARLQRRGVKVTVFDPVSMPRARELPALRGVEFAADAYEAARGADALAIVTEWNEFRNLDLKRIARLMRHPILCDLRNIYGAHEVEAAGLRHVGVGRGRPAAPTPRRRRAAGGSPRG